MVNSTTPSAEDGGAAGEAPRLTLRFLFHELVERFLNLEAGWLRTARELVTRPGPMIRRYVAGERRTYASPFAYLVAMTALHILAQTAVGFRERVVARLGDSTHMSPVQLELMGRFTELMFHNILYLSVGILIPLALLLRVLFRKSGYNLAEVVVFALYFGGEMALFSVVITVLVVVLPLGSMGPMLIGLPVAVIYLSYASVGFFRENALLSGLKAGFAYLASYVLFLLAVTVFTLGYVLLMPHDLGADARWNPVNAAEHGNVLALKEVLDDGADPDTTVGETALHIAATAGNLEIIDLLLEHGADPNVRDYLGRVPMFLALTRNHHEVAERLAEAGTDAAATTDRGTTLVFLAAFQGDIELARWAIDNGADVNGVRDDDTYPTALFAAAGRGHADMVQLLLDHGADTTVQNTDGKTARDLARGPEIRELLASDR